MILIGISVMVGAVVLFAVAAFFRNDYVFYVVSLIALLIHGVADNILTVSVYSIATTEWREDSELYQGYLSAARGIGCMSGPLIATIFVKWLKY